MQEITVSIVTDQAQDIAEVMVNLDDDNNLVEEGGYTYADSSLGPDCKGATLKCNRMFVEVTPIFYSQYWDQIRLGIDSFLEEEGETP